MGWDEAASSKSFWQISGTGPRLVACADRCDDSTVPMTEGGDGSESLPLDRRPARGLPIAGQPGIMGSMAKADPMRSGSPTSPSGLGTAAHAAPWSRPRPRTPDPCSGPVRVAHWYLRPAHGGGAVSARRGRPRRLLIPRRRCRTPGELPRQEQNSTEASYVGSSVDVGG